MKYKKNKSLKLCPRRVKRWLSLSITFALLVFLSFPQILVEAKEGATYVISGSDFQHPNGMSINVDIVSNILEQIKSDGITNPYGFLFAGDYGHNESDATGLQNLVTETFPNLSQKVYIQGNHDDLLLTITNKEEPLSETGNNDPEEGKGPYGVFVINEQDFPTEYFPDKFYAGGVKSLEEVKELTQQTATLLEEYLNEKVKDNFTAPIFIVSHLPLHVTQRTYQGMNNAGASSYADEKSPESCGLYAKNIVDVLNAAGEKGLNIIYLYGHDHGWGFDSVIGGDCVYLEKGEEIRYADGGTSAEPNVESATLQFTYMNSGFVGYYQYDTLDRSAAANDGALTMAIFKITEDTVEVLRYNENGKQALARVPYHTIVPEDDETLGYTGLLTLEEAGGTLDDVTTVKSKIGEEGAVITLNKTIDGAISISGYLVGSIAGVLLVAVVIIVSKKFKKAKGD